MFVVIVGLSIAWVMLYARKVRKNPKLSLTCEADKAKREKLGTVADDAPFTTAQKLVLGVFRRRHAAHRVGPQRADTHTSELRDYVAARKNGAKVIVLEKGGNIAAAREAIGALNSALEPDHVEDVPTLLNHANQTQAGDANMLLYKPGPRSLAR